jgi:predicted DNA-binding transcriptional regulator AlpA
MEQVDTERVLLTPKEAGKILGYSESFLAQRRAAGTGPAYVKVSSRAVRYRREDLDAWVEEQLRTGPADG